MLCMGKVLLCALLEDGGRALFVEKAFGESVKYSLPCVLADEADDPVKALAAAVMAQTGIDVQVGSIVFTGKHNAGSRRRKQFVGALAFACSAKRYSTRVKSRWFRSADVSSLKLSREAEWLKARR